jgi:hypothetical protein
MNSTLFEGERAVFFVWRKYIYNFQNDACTQLHVANVKVFVYMINTFFCDIDGQTFKLAGGEARDLSLTWTGQKYPANVV